MPVISKVLTCVLLTAVCLVPALIEAGRVTGTRQIVSSIHDSTDAELVNNLRSLYELKERLEHEGDGEISFQSQSSSASKVAAKPSSAKNPRLISVWSEQPIEDESTLQEQEEAEEEAAAAATVIPASEVTPIADPQFDDDNLDYTIHDPASFASIDEADVTDVGDEISADTDPVQAWSQYKVDFGKQYSTQEEPVRFAQFRANLVALTQLNDSAFDDVNSNKVGATATGVTVTNVAAPMDQARYGLTIFSDMSVQEMQRYTGLKYRRLRQLTQTLQVADPTKAPVHFASASVNSAEYEDSEDMVAAANALPNDLPANFDWRTKGVVTPIKNQGSCGSCWAFSVTETVESVWALAGNPLLQLSPQQLSTCDSRGNAGCNGGWTAAGFDYVAAHGLMLEKEYPYKAKDYTTSRCMYNAKRVVATVDKHMLGTRNRDEGLLARNLIAYGPITIAVDANSFFAYKGGVMTTSRCSSRPNQMNHAIQLVGWTTDAAGVTSWLVRNSWTARWGEQGYARLQFGTNTCGLANAAIGAHVPDKYNKNLNPPQPNPQPNPQPQPLPNCKS